MDGGEKLVILGQLEQVQDEYLGSFSGRWGYEPNITQGKKAGMQVKTNLNHVQKFKSFVYTKVRWAGGGDTLELEMEIAERANGRPVCSGCGCPRPGYDRLAARRFEFAPLWGAPVFRFMPRAGWSARRVGCGWRRCRGRRGRIT